MHANSAPESGPVSGLGALLELHRADLLRFLAARCGNAEAAQDLLQELWIKAASVESGPIANGRAYLFRMANNLVLDEVRGRRRAMRRDREWIGPDTDAALPPEERADPEMPADEQIASRQEAEILHAAIAALPAGAQRALRLHRIDGFGQAEVAEIMGISRSGVEKHIALAMKHLRNALADCGLFEPAASQDNGTTRGGETRKGRTR